ncbi:hypothetical protein LO762_29860 [Actinocorallia sp. API 0066]|uniref:radical SAM protein n=1 Tax=Actinocorallia sp. API 0066 TaxID=2896846 RepID=UPI001E39E4E3|nr:radical SAM protein [Actinocorallia sp. API 0066]MCD0453355.1 hypothetical protein [Actinocorallia sp. API 0066]
MSAPTVEGAAWIKLSLLSHGMVVDDAFAEWFASRPSAVRRRNFYNSPVWGGARSETPQEIVIRSKAGVPVTVAVNVYGDDTWTLTADRGRPALRGLGRVVPVELTDDLTSLRADPGLAAVANLYGGSALSFFSPRACYFFTDGTNCRFCSLHGTAAETEFANRLTPDEVRRAVAEVLSGEPSRVNQVMIVGGNERNLDTGFLRHVELARAVGEAVEEASAEVSVHVVTMPPRDLGLLGELRQVPGIHVGFNLEVWDSGRFEQVAPGKHADYGQAQILRALRELVAVVGRYRAHSILIAGLESPASTIEGARALAALGVSPIVNAFHSDVHSDLGLTIRPSYEVLAEVAVGLQRVHDEFPIQPYWKGCGRNALDFEARHGLFIGDPLDLAVRSGSAS